MKISVITVCYNSEDHIGECLDSVSLQNSLDVEHIVVDGSSSDKTLSIAKQYPHITTLISEPDKGIYNAMNKGIRLSTGDVVGFLNSDDIFASDQSLANVADAFNEDPDLQAVYGGLVFFDQEINTPVRQWEFPGIGDFRTGWHPAHPTFYAKRELFDLYGAFNEELNLSADFELMLRFIHKHRIKTKYINGTLVKMRIGGVSTGSSRNILKGITQTKKAFLLNGIRYPFLYPIYRYWPKVKGKFLKNRIT